MTASQAASTSHPQPLGVVRVTWPARPRRRGVTWTLMSDSPPRARFTAARMSASSSRARARRWSAHTRQSKGRMTSAGIVSSPTRASSIVFSSPLAMPEAGREIRPVERGRPPGPGPSAILGEGYEVLATQGASELAQGLRLHLADPLAGDGEPYPDLLERVLVLVVETEPQAEDLALARRQSGHRALDLPGQVSAEHVVDRGGSAAVLDEVAQHRVVADRQLKGHGRPRGVLEQAQLL